MNLIKQTVILVLCFFVFTANAQNKQVRTGNQLYQEKKYKEAADAYQQALAKNPTFTPGISLASILLLTSNAIITSTPLR